jgi:hypothetical protein
VRADHGCRDGVRPAYNCQHLCSLLREEVADEEEDVETQGFHQDNRVHLGPPLVEREVQGGIYTQSSSSLIILTQLEDAGEYKDLRPHAHQSVARIIPLLQLDEEEHHGDGTLDKASDDHKDVAETLSEIL